MGITDAVMAASIDDSQKMPAYRTTIDFDLSSRSRSEIKGDVLEEIGHIKNLAYREFTIDFIRLDEDVFEYIKFVLNIRFSGFDGKTYISGIGFIHKEKQDLDKYSRIMLPTCLLGVEDNEKKDVLEFTGYMIDHMFVMVLSHIIDLNKLADTLNHEVELSSIMTEEEIIKLAEISKNYKVIFSAEEDILNSNPACRPDDMYLDRVKLIYADYQCNVFKQILELVNRDAVDEKIVTGFDNRNKAVNYLCKLMLEKGPESIFIAVSLKLRKDEEEDFDDNKAIADALWLNKINSKYYAGNDPIMYALDRCTNPVPGTNICIVYDILKMRKQLAIYVDSCFKAIFDIYSYQYTNLCDINDVESDRFEISIISSCTESLEERADKQLKRTVAQLEQTYREENKNYDKRKYDIN